MAKFGYTSRRKMDPIPGRKYSTEYFKQSARERSRTQQHVDRELERVGNHALSHPDLWEQFNQPDRDYPKDAKLGRKDYYSKAEIMADMCEWIHKPNQDIPSGILGRWNKLFADTGNEIELVSEEKLPPPTNYNNLFRSM
jgi:hypothetical protein